MDCKIEIYGLRWNSVGNISRDLGNGGRDTKLFLHAPEKFFLGPLEEDIENEYNLFLNKDIIYFNGVGEAEFLDKLEERFGRKFKKGESTSVEINDRDIEDIMKYSKKLDNENLNKIISKYRRR